MTKKIALLFTALAIWGCNDVNYDSETRLVVQGQLTDYDGNPLANKDIDVAVFDNYDGEVFTSETYPKDVICRGVSDGEGKFKLVFPAPKGYDNHIGVRINKSRVAYQQKQFLKIYREDFNGFRFDFGDVQLYQSNQVAQFHIEPNQVDFDNDLLELHVEGLMADEFVYINPGYDNLTQLNYALRTNQTITIHYKLAEHNGPNTVITENSVDVAIGSDASTFYTLNY